MAAGQMAGQQAMAAGLNINKAGQQSLMAAGQLAAGQQGMMAAGQYTTTWRDIKAWQRDRLSIWRDDQRVSILSTWWDSKAWQLVSILSRRDNQLDSRLQL